MPIAVGDSGLRHWGMVVLIVGGPIRFVITQ